MLANERGTAAGSDAASDAGSDRAPGKSTRTQALTPKAGRGADPATEAPLDPATEGALAEHEGGEDPFSLHLLGDETPGQRHERLGRAAAEIIGAPPGRDVSPIQALEERRRLARTLEARFTRQLEPGIGMYISVVAGPDPERSGGLEVTILIAPNDWKTFLKIAVGVVVAGGALYWAWSSVGGRDDTGGEPRTQDPEVSTSAPRRDGDQSEPALADGVVGAPSIRGLPNRNNDCFVNSIIQLLAGAYPGMLTANESMRVELRDFVRAHQPGVAIEPAVDALRDALSVPAPDLAALVLAHGPAAPDAALAQAQLAAIAHGRGRHRLLRDDLVSLIQRVNQADGAAIGVDDVQRLRARMMEAGIVPNMGGQEDAQQVLTGLLELFLPRAGTGIGVRERMTIVEAQPDPGVGDDEVADYAGGQFDRQLDAEPLLMVPIGADPGLVEYLNRAYGGSVVFPIDHERARDDGHGVDITRRAHANRFTSLPAVLTLMLQRSLPDGLSDTRPFAMPEQLTLLEGDPPTRRKRYQLATFVHHEPMVVNKEARADRGHYWAHRRHQDRWQQANDRQASVDRQPADLDAPGAHDLPHDINQGYIYSYTLVADDPHAGGGAVAAGTALDVGQLPPALPVGDGLGAVQPPARSSNARKGSSTAPRSTSAPDVEVSGPLPVPVRTRGVDEEPVQIAEVLAAVARYPELGAVAVPPATLALRDPRLPSGRLDIEVHVVEPGSDGDPMWVGPGGDAPALMVSNRADLSDARDWFAMALDRVRQSALAGLKYRPPPQPTGDEPPPLDGTRVLKDQVVLPDAEPRFATTVHATLATWLPGRVEEHDEDERLLNVTMAYAAQLELTQPAAANLVQELSELWLSFNPGIIAGDEDLIRPLVAHLWELLQPMADARRRQHAERVASARVIPAGVRAPRQPAAKSTEPPRPVVSSEPVDLSWFGGLDDDEEDLTPADTRTPLQPEWLMESGYTALYDRLAAEPPSDAAAALLARLQATPKALKQAAYMVAELLGGGGGDASEPSADSSGPPTGDATVIAEANVVLGALGVTAPQVDSSTPVTPTEAPRRAEPTAILAVLNKLQPEVLQVFVDFLEDEEVAIDLDQLTGTTRKSRAQKTLPTSAEIDAACESFFISPADAELVQDLLGFHTAARLISYYRANNAIVSIRALIGQLRKLAVPMHEARWPPLTSASLVLDTNVVKALLLEEVELTAEERAVRRKALALIAHLKPDSLRLPNMVVGELSAFGPGVFQRLEDATSIPCHGVPLDGPRDNEKRQGTYARDLLDMEKAQVGGDKGAPDRGLVADTIHAARDPMDPGIAAPTRMMTADLGIAKHLIEKFPGAVTGDHEHDDDPHHFTTGGLSQAIDVYPIDIPAEFARHGRPAVAGDDGGAFIPPPPVDLAPLHAPAGLGHDVFLRPVGPVERGLHVFHLVALVRSAGGEVVVTGGAVRDAVRGEIPNDVDLTTTLRLGQLDALLASHDRFAGLGREITRMRGLRLLKISTGNNPIDITCADDGEDKDLDADGLAHDAGKRDFRMNALYLDGDGALHDPTGEGVADTLQKRLVIVADKFFGDLTTSVDPPFEEIGRSFKFVGREYEMPEEQQVLLRDAYVALIERARRQDATEIADTVRMMEKAREKTPVEILQVMIKLGFSDVAIRALFPDSMAGRAADRTPAFERAVVPRHLDNPATADAVVPGATSQVKVDEEHGRVYQYRVFARTEDPAENLMIDIDMTDHDLAGHRAQHHHIYRWKASGGGSGGTWDKHISGISKTGQPGRPDLDGDLYRGPRPWLIEEGLDEGGDVGTLVKELNQNLAGFSYQAEAAGELIDLGGELQLHPAKLQSMRRNGTLRTVFMLIENVKTQGKMPPPQDRSLDELTKTGGERLRFERHLTDVDLMLGALDVAQAPLLVDPPIGDRIRLYDLVRSWRERPGPMKAAIDVALARNPGSIEVLVELTEAHLAMAEHQVADPDTRLAEALVAGSGQAPGALAGATPEEQQVAIKAAALGGALRFASSSAAAYHWLKHGDEVAPGGTPAGGFPLDAYVAAANAAVAAPKDVTTEIEQTGATAFVYQFDDDNGGLKVVVNVSGGQAHLSTCFRRTPRLRDDGPVRVPAPEALERLAPVTTLVAPATAPPEEQVEHLVAALEQAVARAQGPDNAARRAAIVHLVPWARGRVDGLPDVDGERLDGWRARLDQVAVLAVA